MKNLRDPDQGGELSVFGAWRILARPVPTYRVSGAGYVGLGLVILLLNLSAISAIVAAIVTDLNVAMVAALLHTALIPGLLLAIAVLPTRQVCLAEWIVAAFGLSLLVAIVGGVVLAMAPVRLTPFTVVGWTALVTLVIAAVAFQRGLRWRPPERGSLWLTLGPLVVAVVALALRLPGLGYSEFQGDETEVMLRATGVVQNLPDALYYHGKGPGEVVVVAVQYGLLGATSELAARLPFAIAGAAGVAAFYLLGFRLLGSGAGALAVALLLAVNGFFIAFSRIAQYQSAVLLLGLLGVWCALRWAQTGHAVWPILAGAFISTAALAHYDAIWFLPPILVVIASVVVRVIRTDGWAKVYDPTLLGVWSKAAIVGVVILSLFFVPYLDSPLFSLATGRIQDRVGSGFPYNNLRGIVALADLYLGPVYPWLIVGLPLLGVVALIRTWISTSSRRALLVALVWTAVPFLFYAFVARKPGTHIHVASYGLLLLAGAGLGMLWGWLTGSGRGVRSTQGILALLFLGTLCMVGTWVVPIFLQSTAEISRQNRYGRLPFVRNPVGDYAAKERFGFPYQAGWKAVGALFADGTLSGSYDSNEQPQVTYWYTRGAWRCSANPRYYLIAERAQDPIDLPTRVIQSDYHRIGTVTVTGEEKLEVYERGRSAGARPTSWRAEDLAPVDRQVSRPTFDPGVWARGAVSREAVRLAVRFGDDVDLLGYQIYSEDPRPGGVARADLFWMPHVTAKEQHRIDIQVGSDPRIGDGGGPACDKTNDDKDWVRGRPFVQRVSIPIAASARPGSYPLLVSVSRLGASGGVLYATGSPSGDGSLVEIGHVEIRDSRGAAR